jgi:PilZ domain
LLEKPRARRYPLVATIDVTDVDSEAEVRGQITDLSLFGCHISIPTPWPTGTKIRLRIAHRGAVFAALGYVANAPATGGIGVIFSSIEQKDQLVLETWLAELRDGRKRVSQKIK